MHFLTPKKIKDFFEDFDSFPEPKIKDFEVKRIRKSAKGNRFVTLILIFSFFTALSMVTAVSADSSVIYVNGSHGNDSWSGTSWETAKLSIKNATGTVAENGTVYLANGVYRGVNNTNITIDKNMAVIGQSQKGTIINGTNTSQIFNIPSNKTLVIMNLTIANGGMSSCSDGGAVVNQGNLIIDSDTFTGNSASHDGGVIYNTGNLFVNKATFTDNSASAEGGVIKNYGTLVVYGSTFKNNFATWLGGAICNYNISVVNGSIFTGNKATNGGAIYNYQGIVSVNASTFTNNTANSLAGGYGGAIENGGGSLIINGSTFTGNTAGTGGGAIISDGYLAVNFSRIVGNTAAKGSDIYKCTESDSVDPTAPFDADYNWWGSNSGPSAGSIYGAGVTKWLVLKVTASSTTINVNGTSTITADLTHDNNGTYHNPSGGHVPDGTPVYFTTTLGSISSPVTLVNGIAKSTLKGGLTAGAATVSAKMDNQTVKASVTVAKTFTITQIKQAATKVRNYIEANHRLPNYVAINGTNVTMPQFLELETTALLQINAGNNNVIPLRSVSAPTSSKDTIKAGNIYKTEYLKIANSVKSYIDSNGKAQGYAYQTSLGTYLGYQNLVYMYSRILDYYNKNGKLANYVTMKPWSKV